MDRITVRSLVNLPDIRRGETATLPLTPRVAGLIDAGRLEQVGRPQRRLAAPAPVDPVPSGTVREVLAWVDSDRDRAERALDRELSTTNARVTLVNALMALVDQEAASSSLSDDSPSEGEDTGEALEAVTRDLRAPSGEGVG